MSTEADSNAMTLIQFDERAYRDEFDILLRRQGWHMTHCKPLYTDPQVIAIRKAGHPLSLERGASAWLGLLGDNTFRKLLRSLMGKRRSAEELSRICGDQVKLNWYLAMLEGAGILIRSDDSWERGPQASSIDNIGPTLEWYVAEWFRSERGGICE